jgi:putative two-component system response regulator
MTQSAALASPVLDEDEQIEIAAKAGLEELTTRLARARGVEEILRVVRGGARRLVGADGITFVLREDDKCYYADEDAIGPLWKGQRFPLERCISGWAMLHGEAVVIEDVYADDRIPHAAYRPTFVQSLVMVPVHADDPVAAIGGYWARPHRPSEQSVEMLKRIANSAAVAMTNVALFSSLNAAREEAVRAKDALILAMAALADTRDNETGDHIRRTQHYVRALAEAARRHGLYQPELDAELTELLYKSAPLHDIGKVGISDAILRKPGKLDAEEFATMRTHAKLGRDAIANAERYFGGTTSFLTIAKDMAYSHHERWDGKGYPEGLAGQAIPLCGRIMAIADVYDALVSDRVYKAAIPHAEAVKVIESERGRHFDPALVDVFIEIAPVFQEINNQFSNPV